MLRVPVVIFLVGFCFLTNNCGPKITPAETRVRAALEAVRHGTEANIEYGPFVQLLETANNEISNLRRHNKASPCFMGSVDKCYSAYEIARKAWKKMLDERNETRKADMELTLSFSLSFAALNIEKANKCFK
jgi:hypothetical protein